MSRRSPLSTVRGLFLLLIIAGLLGACATSTGSRWGKPKEPATGLYGVADGKLVYLGDSEQNLKDAAEIDSVSALTYDPTAKQFYALAGAKSQPRLVALDPATGAVSAIGLLTLPDLRLTLADALAFDPKSGMLYAAGGRSTFASNVLLTVDPATGEAQQIGPIQGTAQSEADAMAFVDGTLYAIDSSGKTSTLYRIDTDTGEATRVGESFGKSVTDLAFDATTRRLIGAQSDGPPLTISLDAENIGEMPDTAGAATALAIIPKADDASLFADSFETGDASAWTRRPDQRQG